MICVTQRQRRAPRHHLHVALHKLVTALTTLLSSNQPGASLLSLFPCQQLCHRALQAMDTRGSALELASAAPHARSLHSQALHQLALQTAADSGGHCKLPSHHTQPIRHSVAESDEASRAKSLAY